MTFKIYPYKQGSRSVRALADALEASSPSRRKHLQIQPRNVHINWGNGSVTNLRKSPNQTGRVEDAQ